MRGRLYLAIAFGLLAVLVIFWILPEPIFSKDKVRAYLGVSVQEVTKKYRKKYNLNRNEGILVSYVAEDSPADLADIESGDVILEVDGSKLKSPRHFARLIRKKNPGDKISMQVIHDGKKKALQVELAEQDKEDENAHFFFAAPGAFAFSSANRPYLGVYLQDLNEDLAKYFNVNEESGVLITEVEEDSPAADAGVKPGDILAEIDEEKVASSDDALEILSEYDPGDKVAITVIRSGSQKKIEIELEESSSNWNSTGIYVSPRSRGRSFRIEIPRIPKIKENARRLREIINLKLRDQIHNEIEDNIRFHFRDQERLIIEDALKNKEELLQQIQELNEMQHKQLRKISEDIIPIAEPESASSIYQSLFRL